MQVSISKAREVYRPVAVRGSLLYFLVDSLNNLDRVYHYSMAAFVQILKKGGLRWRLPLHDLTSTTGCRAFAYFLSHPLSSACLFCLRTRQGSCPPTRPERLCTAL